MKKTLAVCLLVFSFVLVGCSSSEALEPKEKDYTSVIEAALNGYEKDVEERELVENDEDIEYYAYDRDKSDIMIWEDENNYFVYFRKNYSDSVYGDLVHGFACKIGKSNDRWSSSWDERNKITEYLNDNEPTIYEEHNIELVDDDFDMR